MSAVALATKVCRTCGEDKPLSEFHRKRSSPDGHQSECRRCSASRARERQQRQRNEMGEERYLAYRAELTRKSRQRTSNTAGKQYDSARRAATAALVDRHRAEFEHLLTLARRGELPGQVEATT